MGRSPSKILSRKDSRIKSCGIRTQLRPEGRSEDRWRRFQGGSMAHGTSGTSLPPRNSQQRLSVTGNRTLLWEAVEGSTRWGGPLSFPVWSVDSRVGYWGTPRPVSPQAVVRDWHSRPFSQPFWARPGERLRMVNEHHLFQATLFHAVISSHQPRINRIGCGRPSRRRTCRRR